MAEHDDLSHFSDAASDPWLRPTMARLDALGAAYAAERAGLADRVHRASVAQLGGHAPLARIGRWAWPVAAAAAAALAVVLTLPAWRPASRSSEGSVVGVAARTTELPGSGRSERLLVTLLDSNAAVASGEPTSDDASALAILRARDVDDFTVELDELLSVGGRR
jgi:hypothetical protein